MTQCADCKWCETCRAFARCILEPIPDEYQDLSTGEVLRRMISGESARLSVEEVTAWVDSEVAARA